jgi:acyl-CoA thioester hydrolase
MNNATYLSLFEEARWEMITQRGFGLSEIKARQLGPVILSCEVKFAREVLLREQITITTDLLDYRGKIGRLTQKMLKPSGEVACEATFTFGLFDLKERKLIDPTPEWKVAVGLS